MPIWRERESRFLLAHRHDVAGMGANPYAPPAGGSPGPTAKIYFQGEGSERDLKRFQKFLDIALDDYGMAQTGSSKDADVTVKMHLSHEEETQNLYAPVVWVTMASRDHEQYIFKSCNSVSTATSIFDEPIKDLVSFKFPDTWKPRNGRMAVYVNETEVKGLQTLVPEVKKQLADDGYRVTQARGDADAELQSIKLQKLAIPMRTAITNRAYELLDRNAKRFQSGQGFTDVNYIGVVAGINVANLPCRTTVETFHNSPDRSWDVAHTIAQRIREHLDEASHSN